MTDHVLELCAVRKAFGSVVAIDDLDLAVDDRELLAVVGPSGCGKSTLLRLVAGLAHVDAGRIRIGDAVVDDGDAGSIRNSATPASCSRNTPCSPT